MKQILCKCHGGSRLYSLETPQSDIDERGIFLHSDPNFIIGLGRYEHEQNRSEDQDVEYKEYRAALGLIKSGNTQMLELLNNDKWLEIHPIWRRTQEKKHELFDSERIFKCLSGFAMSERRNAFEKNGRIGEKRKEAIDKYGFSPKNVVHYLRLVYTGDYFFSKGLYITNIKEVNEFFWCLLMDIKTSPQSYSREHLIKTCELYDESMKKAFDSRRETFKFNDKVANQLILNAYLPVLKGLTNPLMSFNV
jgi:predicted nucleotidyltransferase